MECKKVRDQLITKYADKELAPDKRLAIDRHLAACPDCREFFGAFQKTAAAPFKGAETLKPDGVVWERIQERIEAEHARPENWFGKLADALAPLLKVPQPVFRAAFVAALVFAVMVLARWPFGYVDPVYIYMSEQMTFMEELRAGNTDLMNGDLKGYDAVFEEMIG